ncbi:MAG: sugar ABC transporter ATP-binding protein [Blautia sp.]|nr:sugar ABC transporter ATP-binding protein [Blautia sp.]
MGDVNLNKADDVILTMKGIDKSFPGVHALDHVDLELRRGEVHALMGENGAGKSTLMKVLTGIYTKDSGSIWYEGREVEFHNTHEAQEAGIVIVHQELNMVGDLTVAQNIFIGREFKKGIMIDDKKMIRESRKLFDELKIDIDPKAKMSDLTVGKQQMCEIAKAISHKAKVIIFDEPSAALTEKEIEDLFSIIRDLRAQNLGIIYISHRMDEIKVITDRVTVMRDGAYVGTLITDQCTKEDIINMMVGRVIYEDPKTKSAVPADAPVVLKVEHLNAGKMVQDVSFELHKGEILGFSGLMGAGRTETARALFGADPKQSGDIYINGEKVEINSPEDAVKHGIGYLSEDRKRFGIVVQKSITENSTLATLDQYMSGMFINKAEERKITERYIDELSTKTPGPDQLVVNLSGGNQQKVVIAKWLVRNCDILIFDEPTRGIDVGAKNEIYKLMNRLAAEGKSIIMISSEMTEILRMSDRIVIMCEGRKTGEIRIEEATQEAIMDKATRDIK